MPFFTLRLSLLNLHLQFCRWLSSKWHIVGLVQFNDRDKSAETFVLRFKSQPLPFCPSICQSCIVSRIIFQTDRPHYSCIEVSCNVLILQNTEVRSRTSVGIHAGRVNAICFIFTNQRISRNNSSLWAEESTIEILDEIVLKSRTNDITTATEPSN